MLTKLYNPKGVAVIGASNKRLSIGYRVIANLKEHGFRGAIYPVNPKDPEIQGLKAYKSVLDTPGPVDLVNISIKNSFCPRAVKECGEKGVKFVILHTSGFREAGEEGAKLEKEILEIAEQYGMRIYGPNSQGVMNSNPEVSLYANFTFTPMKPGSVSILAQSGGVAEVLNLNLRKMGFGFRMYASPGNASDVSMTELLDYFGSDSGTNVIMMHIESLRDPMEFARVAAQVTRNKPILALKSGVTEEGARAVSSHTGSLSSPDRAMDALFEKCGIMRFHDQREMIEAATALASQKVPGGRKVAMITNAGGPAIIAVDECISNHLELASLHEETKKAISEKVLSVAHVGNPLDLAATANPEHYGRSIEKLLADGNVHGLIVNMITPFFVDNQGIAKQVVERAKKGGKPVLPVVMTNEKWQDVIDILREGDLPVFDYPEAASRAMAALCRWNEIQSRPEAEPPAFEVDRQEARHILGNKTGYLSYKDAAGLLTAYGINTADVEVISGETDLDSVVEDLGFPLAMKVDSPQVVHKSDARGVVLGIDDIDSARKAFKELETRFKGKDATIVAQAMAEPGTELIVGTARAQGMGSTILLGLGGVFVEVMKDVSIRLAPVGVEEAKDMLGSIKASPILKGARGAKPIDIDDLAEMVARVSMLAADFPQIAELDINPVFAYPADRKSTAVDFRIRVDDWSRG
ncbi:MAG: acetate--CoA ligase family protein [Deltaproteobacteria bacterium]|nr:acetate--CoA ligase family protein [Deltaproteobacteria bacterium]